MTEFSFLYRGREVPTSAEHTQKTTEKWMAWFKELGAQGHVKELGHPLEYTGAVVTGKQKTVVDGPFAEAKDMIGGYSVIVATDLAHAAEIAKGCPILEAGGSVEVRPIQKMNV